MRPHVLTLPPEASRRAFRAIQLLFCCGPLVPQCAHAGETWDVFSDTWVATDALGRELPGPSECGPPRPGKTVGIFYFLWLGQHGGEGPFDISRLLDGGGKEPAWGPPGAFHHWGEPELGYYVSTDESVIRRHAEQLVDALVDTVIFDVTNGPTYPDVYQRVARVYERMRAEGARTPQITFLLNAGAPQVAARLYEDFYGPGRHRDLWFLWEGRPLLLAPGEGHSAEISSFFTFRRSWAWSGTPWFGDGRDRWPWLDHTPQQAGWHVPGVPEQIPVAVAEHPTSNIGRSFHAGRQPPPGERDPSAGHYFEEQWRRALEVNPAFVLVTGWNEWVAQRFVAAGGETFLGRKLAAGETYFVDQYSREFSRDIEPMKGGHSDNYYYQLMANVRRFKGVRPLETAGAPVPIRVDGLDSDWEAVRPELRDTKGDAAHRDEPGWGATGRLVDRSGRNDLVRMKVERDASKLYFLACAAEPWKCERGQGWLGVLLDVDSSARTGWGGYELRVRVESLQDRTARVEKWSPGSGWSLQGDADLSVAGTVLELGAPRELLEGLPREGLLQLDLHWVDTLGSSATPEELRSGGDQAPNRRANYRYRG